MSLAVTSGAADWPQWRGPHFNGADDQQFKILYAGKTDQTPIQSSIANGRLYIRTAENLYAVGE